LMPLWAWIAIAAGTIAVLAGATIAGIVAYRAAERRYLLRLVRSREGLDFVRQALGDSLGRLAEGSERELSVFADDPESSERRALHEVASRARLLADELDTTPLPGKLVPAAEALADAAYLIGREAGRVGDELMSDAALEALGCIDLDTVETYYRAAVSTVQGVCEACGLEDSAVYGGGLYL
jgi:hypothetical protein